jgi:hypothetical protein
LEIILVEQNPPSSLYLSITEHKAYVLDRSDELDIGNKNIVLYQQRMLTLPWHLILPSHLSEVRDALHSSL